MNYDVKKIDDKTITVNGVNKSANFHAEEKKEGVVSMVPLLSCVNEVYSAHFSSFTIEGIPASSAADAVRRLNAFVGNFKGAGGDSPTPTPTDGIKSITNNGFTEVFKPDEEGNCDIMTGTPPFLKITNPRAEWVDDDFFGNGQLFIFDIPKSVDELNKKIFTLKYDYDYVDPINKPPRFIGTAVKTTDGINLLILGGNSTLTFETFVSPIYQGVFFQLMFYDLMFPPDTEIEPVKIAMLLSPFMGVANIN